MNNKTEKEGYFFELYSKSAVYRAAPYDRISPEAGADTVYGGFQLFVFLSAGTFVLKKALLYPYRVRFANVRSRNGKGADGL